jgi:hypothetical protein
LETTGSLHRWIERVGYFAVCLSDEYTLLIGHIGLRMSRNVLQNRSISRSTALPETGPIFLKISNNTGGSGMDGVAVQLGNVNEDHHHWIGLKPNSQGITGALCSGKLSVEPFPSAAPPGASLPPVNASAQGTGALFVSRTPPGGPFWEKNAT